jgi:hypothetical protein
MRGITVKRVQRRLAALAGSIKALADRATRKGKPIPWGVLVPPPPNTTPGRTPAPFTGGN